MTSYSVVATGVERGRVLLDSATPAMDSHLMRIRDHLSRIPTNQGAQGKVKMIRLLRKSLFCENQSISLFLNQIISILSKTSLQYNRKNLRSSRPIGCVLTEQGAVLLEELISNVDPFRETIQKLLIWDEAQSDDMFELFQLENCPSFTFISHRWAPSKPNNRALGLHNELAFIIGLCPTEYIWLDCGCAPQDHISQKNGDCLKVIWNIQEILDKAVHVLSYYATDGFCLKMHDDDDDIDGEKIVASAGFLRIYELTVHIFKRYMSSLLVDKVSENSAVNSGRLWCVFEKLLGGDKFLTDNRILSLPYSICIDDESVENFDCYDHRCRLHIHRIRYLEFNARIKSLYMSLDCFDIADVGPLTMILYTSKKLPAVFNAGIDTLPFIIDGTNSRVYALQLPKYDITDESLEKNGWTTHEVKETAWNPREDVKTTFYFHCDWPQSTLHPEIRLHIHADCLSRYSSDLWSYDIQNARITGYFNREWDHYSETHFHKRRCILCTSKPCEEWESDIVTEEADKPLMRPDCCTVN